MGSQRRPTLAVALAACVGLGVTGSASASAPRRACDVVEGYREKTVQSHFIRSDASSKVPGDAVVYYDEIYDAVGRAVGHAVGYATITDLRASDGHEIVYYSESLQLPGGILRDSGTIDATAVHGGSWARFPATGTAGGYLGKKGVRQWKIISVDDLLVELRVVLCA
jgi:hypothetical protein